MLEAVCNFVHNYFELERRSGNFTIVGSVVSPSFFKEGQRFRIIGSALNDGIYTYHSDGIYNDDDTEQIELQDEEFYGSIAVMGIPKRFETIIAEMNEWQEKNKDALSSPYTSESFGGYSYTKASGGSGSGSGGMLTVFDAFRTQLNAYRKIA